MLTRVGVTRGAGPDPGRGRTSVVTAPTDPGRMEIHTRLYFSGNAQRPSCPDPRRVLIPAGIVLVVVVAVVAS
jgi:hypothetical protein